MSGDRRNQARELKARWDAGGLDPAAEAELAAMISADQALAEEFGDDLLVDRLLRHMAIGADEDAFLRGVAARIDAASGADSPVNQRSQSRRPSPRAAQGSHRAARSQRQASRPLAFAAITVALALLTALLVIRPWEAGAGDHGLPVLSAAVASVEIDGRAVGVGTTLAAQAELRVGPQGSCTIGFSDGSTLELAGGTVLRAPGPFELWCGAGAVDCRIERRSPDAPFRVHSPHGTVTVIGTRFRVSVDASTRVAVTEGTVAVEDRRDGQRRLLAAGEAAELLGHRSLAEDPGAIVSYDFSTASGSVVHDDAARGGSLDLAITEADAVEWLPGEGLRLRRPTLLRSQHMAKSVIEACRASGELSIVAVVSSDPRVLEGDPSSYPRRIISISSGTKARDLTLGQGLYHGEPGVIEVRLRSTASDENGRPSVVSAEPLIAPRRQHLVYTRAADGRCRLYVDGLAVPLRVVEPYDQLPIPYRGEAAPVQELRGELSAWEDDMPLVVGGELGDLPGETKREWLGTLHQVAILDRALSADEVAELVVRDAADRR